ncbi:hypothetical protein [Verminephrobacter eiseniae]|uniref:hypothetical protein n=1 Tax=Verminephrobacter eiseniae TaxID=364317 RepID=UPI00223872F0|nr:hypothetical protein [Verminephrobacter eiseniae]MCW5235920.1 hypothetical protein [Verminephrobacter eiseniae]
MPPRTLAGFSSGGGCVVRHAASADAKAFQRFLLPPFGHLNCAAQRENSAGQVRAGMHGRWFFGCSTKWVWQD